MDERSVVSAVQSYSVSIKSEPKKRSTKKVNILDIQPVDLARQLTLIVFERFKLVKPYELYSTSWSKENANTMAPNVLSLIKHFNRVSDWLASEIVVCKNLKKRASLLKHFITIATTTMNYRDCETTFAIVLGLQRAPISRLSETWKSLDNNTKALWEKLTEFTSFQGNYRNYRTFMKKSLAESSILSGKNLIPYFGLYLKDLSSLEENSNFTVKGAVNFYKMRMVASVISEVIKTQSSIYNFTKDVKLLNFLSYEIPNYDEDTIWELSKSCESYSTEDATKIKASSSSDKTEILTTTSNPIFGVQKAQKSSSSSNVVHKLISKFETSKF